MNGISRWTLALATVLMSTLAATQSAQAQTFTQTVTTLYSFCSQLIASNCTDGQGSEAPLIQANDGNFYGTTSLGGANGWGTIFKITPSGTLTTLYSFCSIGGSSCTDGASPRGLIQATDGNIYGTTIGGGTYSSGGGGSVHGGTIFKITPAGSLTTLYSFCSQSNCADGSNPTGELVLGIDGNLYGIAAHGGAIATDVCAYGCGTVFEISLDGTLATLYRFCSQNNCTDGAFPLGGLFQANDGNFYGTTFGGGANINGTDCHAGILYTCGTIFKITPNGELTTLYSFCSQPACVDGSFPAAGLIQATDGKLYGTTQGNGTSNSGNPAGTVFMVTLSGALTTLYQFCSQQTFPYCTDGFAPGGLIQATDGSLYGITSASNPGGGTIFQLPLSGALTTLYSFCAQPKCADGGNSYARLMQATDGNLYGTTYSVGANGTGGTVFKFPFSPTATPAVSGTLGTNGWYVGKTTTVAWTVSGIPTPTTSGCGTVTVPQTTGTTYTCSATNARGSASTSVTIKEDSVKPSVTIKKPAAGAVYALNQKVLASYSCLDATSGAASCLGTVADGVAIKTSALGTQSFAVAGTDNAGNTITKAVLYTVDPGTATPAFSLKTGTYTGPQQVSITDATTGAVIYYTTNGNTPSLSSRVYTSPITIKSTTTLKARAIAANDAWSKVKSATYTIQ